MKKKTKITTLILSLGALAGCLIWVIILHGIDTFTEKPITLYVSTFLYIVFTFTILRFAFDPKELTRHLDRDLGSEEVNEENKGIVAFYYMFAIPFFQLAAFILICRSMWLLGLPNFQVLPNSVSDWTWVLYGADNLSSVFAFDLPQIYGFSWSHVEHAHTRIMSSLIFSYRFSISVGLIKIILLSYRELFLKQ